MNMETIITPKDDLHMNDEKVHDFHYFDENTGKPLDHAKVKKGDEKELEKLKGRGVYEYASRSEAQSGKLIKTRWVRTEKGQDVRSRFVAQEFAAGDPRDDLFASTPPLFAARQVVSLAAVSRKRMWSLMCLDVSCAFLYAGTERQLYIEIPMGGIPGPGTPT